MQNEPVITMEKPKPRRRVRAFTVVLVVLLVIVAILGRNFHTVEVRGRSMMPTLKEGQRVLVSNAYWLVGEVRKGDIVVVKEFQGEGYFIKRVHALGGSKVDKPFQPRTHSILDGDFIVPNGMVHLIGDNLPESDDSRKFGPVKLDQLLGKVLVWGSR